MFTSFQARGMGGTDPEVLIVGAGITGLSLAYHLKKQGISYKIFESTPRVGGRIRTILHKDSQLDAEAGLEEFWDNNPIVPIIRELGLPLEAGATAFSSFTWQGKVYPFVQDSDQEFLQSFFTLEEMRKFKAWDDKTGIILKRIKLLRAGSKPLDKDILDLIQISFSDWLTREKLPEKVKNFIDIETRHEFGQLPKEISALDGILEWEIFHERTPSHHIKGGNYQLPEALAKAVGEENIFLSEQVTQIQNGDKDVLITTRSNRTFETRQHRGRYVVTTMPLYALNEIQIEPSLPESYVHSIATQTWGAYCTAHVILDKQAEHFWLSYGEDALPFLTDTPLGVIYGGSPSHSQQTILNLLVTGSAAEQFNHRGIPIDMARGQLIKELSKMWPGIEKYVRRFEFVRYHPRAIASWPVGRSRLDEMSDLLRKPYKSLFFAGDFTEGTHSTDGVISALRVAGQLNQMVKHTHL